MTIIEENYWLKCKKQCGQKMEDQKILTYEGFYLALPSIVDANSETDIPKTNYRRVFAIPFIDDLISTHELWFPKLS